MNINEKIESLMVGNYRNKGRGNRNYNKNATISRPITKGPTNTVGASLNRRQILMGPPKRLPPRTKKSTSSSSSTTTLGSIKTVFHFNAFESSLNTTTTSTEEGSMLDSDSRIIIAICEGRGQATCEIGLAVIDLENPALILCQFSDVFSYIKTLTKLNMFLPKQILVPVTFLQKENRLVSKIRERFKNCTLVPIPRSNFNKQLGMNYVQKVVAPNFNSVIITLQQRFYTLSAAGALMSYAEENCGTRFANQSLKVSYEESENCAVIDLITADHLELVMSANPMCKNRYGCLFGVLNHCRTRIGMRRLRASILQPPCEISEIESRLDVVTELLENAELLNNIQERLKSLTNIDQLLTFGFVMPTQANLCTERQLNYLLLLNLILSNVDPLEKLVYEGKSPFFREIQQTLRNKKFIYLRDLIREIIHADCKPARGQIGNLQRCFAIKEGINTMLDVLRKTYSEKIEDLRNYVENLAKNYKMPVKLSHNCKKGFHIQYPLTVHQRNSMSVKDFPDLFIHVEKMQTCFTMRTMDFVNITTRIDEILEEILGISNIIVYKTLCEVRKEIGIFYKLCDEIAYMDMLQSLAQASCISKYIRPKFSTYMELTASQHPLLDYLCSHEPVANNVFASKDYNFHIITGPNMSGKSIYIRQIVLLQIMAQVGCYVPAVKAVFRVADKIFAKIYLEDNMEIGASALVLEIKEIQYFFNTMSENSLIIIDELARSTSEEEGTALAWSMSEKFLKTKAFIFLTTHFFNLTRLEEVYFSVKNWQLETLEEQGEDGSIKMKFTHVLIPGVTTIQNYGMKISEGFLPKEIMERAKEIRKYVKVQVPIVNQAIRFEWRGQKLKYDLEADLELLHLKGELTQKCINDRLKKYEHDLRLLGEMNYNNELIIITTENVQNLHVKPIIEDISDIVDMDKIFKEDDNNLDIKETRNDNEGNIKRIKLMETNNESTLISKSERNTNILVNSLHTVFAPTVPQTSENSNSIFEDNNLNFTPNPSALGDNFCSIKNISQITFDIQNSEIDDNSVDANFQTNIFHKHQNYFGINENSEHFFQDVSFECTPNVINIQSSDSSQITFAVKRSQEDISSSERELLFPPYNDSNKKPNENESLRLIKSYVDCEEEMFKKPCITTPNFRKSNYVQTELPFQMINSSIIISPKAHFSQDTITSVSSKKFCPNSTKTSTPLRISTEPCNGPLQILNKEIPQENFSVTSSEIEYVKSLLVECSDNLLEDFDSVREEKENNIFGLIAETNSSPMCLKNDTFESIEIDENENILRSEDQDLNISEISSNLNDHYYVSQNSCRIVSLNSTENEISISYSPDITNDKFKIKNPELNEDKIYVTEEAENCKNINKENDVSKTTKISLKEINYEIHENSEQICSPIIQSWKNSLISRGDKCSNLDVNVISDSNFNEGEIIISDELTETNYKTDEIACTPSQNKRFDSSEFENLIPKIHEINQISLPTNYEKILEFHNKIKDISDQISLESTASQNEKDSSYNRLNNSDIIPPSLDEIIEETSLESGAVATGNQKFKNSFTSIESFRKISRKQYEEDKNRNLMECMEKYKDDPQKFIAFTTMPSYKTFKQIKPLIQLERRSDGSWKHTDLTKPIPKRNYKKKGFEEIPISDEVKRKSQATMSLLSDANADKFKQYLIDLRKKNREKERTELGYAPRSSSLSSSNTNVNISMSFLNYEEELKRSKSQSSITSFNHASLKPKDNENKEKEHSEFAKTLSNHIQYNNIQSKSSNFGLEESNSIKTIFCNEFNQANSTNVDELTSNSSNDFVKIKPRNKKRNLGMRIGVIDKPKNVNCKKKYSSRINFEESKTCFATNTITSSVSQKSRLSYQSESKDRKEDEDIKKAVERAEQVWGPVSFQHEIIFPVRSQDIQHSPLSFLTPKQEKIFDQNNDDDKRNISQILKKYLE